AARDANNWQARLMVIFMILFLVGSVWSAIYYAPYMLGYGPNIFPTSHARDIMGLFNVTLFFTGIVFVLTQIALFWFAYKYREQTGRKALYISHDNKLEIIWTIIPAVVMSILVVLGLDVWNNTMADVDYETEMPMGLHTGEEGQYLEIEATGQQFGWVLRHPGRDGLIGTKNWKMIDGTNEVGQDFTDSKNIDDLIIPSSGALVLPVNTKIRARITSKDVLHNFDIPHFMVKMDAIPGIPTYFVFEPEMTTKEYRKHLSQFPEWNTPFDSEEPDGLKRWEAFNFELACAELCGKAHYSMRRVVEVVSVEEYNDWLRDTEATSSTYLNEIRNTDKDPFIDQRNLRIEQDIKDWAIEKEKRKQDKLDAIKEKQPKVEAPVVTPESNEEEVDSVSNDSI
ncbi:MAG: cytochrome c oxidase subunit II, partial [Saprospiraceae bacterium]